MERLRSTWHNWDHRVIVDYLMGVFRRDESRLLLMAAIEPSRRWNLTIVLDYPDFDRNNMGGQVNYNKRSRRFDFIQYTDQLGWAMRISISSGAYWSARDHRDFLYRNVPEYYHPEKKLAEWLRTH